MSLFDVIKYPISDPPTAEELIALPDGLYNKWCTAIAWCTLPNPACGLIPHAYNLSDYMQKCRAGMFATAGNEEVNHYLTKLRRLIIDYD